MPLHDHPYSDVNIIYSVVQTGERTTDRGANSAPNIKRLCNGEYRPGQLHTIQSSSPRYHWCRCTCAMYKTGCIKDGGKRKILKGFPKETIELSGTTETCRHQVNERSAWLPQRSMKVNWQPHVFHLHNKKEKKSVRCKSESVCHKI
jgi:hypothetical protein